MRKYPFAQRLYQKRFLSADIAADNDRFGIEDMHKTDDDRRNVVNPSG